MPKGYSASTITPTPEIIADILSSELSIRSLCTKHNMGYTHVRNILKRAGITKTSKTGPVPKPKPPKVIKEKKPKELPIRVIKKEVKSTANTKFELQKERLENAKSAQEVYREMEIKKIAEGYKYVKRIGRFGILETVLVKQN